MRLLWWVAICVMVVWIIELTTGAVGIGSFVHWLLLFPLLLAVAAFLNRTPARESSGANSA